MSGEDASYCSWLRQQKCAAQPCTSRAEVHHHTSGSVLAPDEPQGKKLPGRRGKGQKAHDYYGIPLCPHHHRQFHTLRGYFGGYEREDLRQWQNEQVTRHRERYESQ